MSKVTKEELAKLRERMVGKEIVFAPQDLIQSLGPYVQRVLDAIGHPEAFVSDESWVSDFDPFEASEEEVQAYYDEIGQKLGFPVTGKDTIYGLAARLRGTV